MRFSLQEAEWHCDEFTKGACFSRGKSEVSVSSLTLVALCIIQVVKIQIRELHNSLCPNATKGSFANLGCLSD